MGFLEIFKKKKQDKEITNTEEVTNKEETYSRKAFIFCEEEELNKIMNVFCDTFGSSSGKGNTLELHNGDINVFVTVVTAGMGDDIKTFIKDQVDRTYGHFYEVDTKYVDIKTNVLYKINATHGFVIINYSFNSEDKYNKQTMIEQMFVTTLPKLRGIILLSGQEDGLYCESDKRGMELILSDGGKSSLLNYLPHQEFNMTPESGQTKEEQINRRLKSRKIIKDKFIYIPVWYPLIETEEQSKFRSKEEIAKRAVALMIVSLYSECLLGEGMEVDEAYQFVSNLIERFGAEEFFSPREKEYLHNPDSTEEERIAYSWQYENLFVMEWALGLVDELDFPDHLCNVPLTVQLLKNYNSIKEILEKSTPKSKESLLDECDLIFCLNWACVDTRIHSLPAPAGMDSGVVVERHKSLNWLVGDDESAEWDNVRTDT